MIRSAKFEIKLPLFEGPFDLLLFFIERDELDIYDIPIAKITNDFLQYLTALKKMDIEVASEFIVVAASLMKIKAAMLLPRPVLNEEGEVQDPRAELLAHLLEYKKYKSVVSKLEEMEIDRKSKEKRGNLEKEVEVLSRATTVEAELQDLNLFKLMHAFEKVMKRYGDEQNRPVHRVIQYPYSIETQKELLMKKLHTNKKIAFTELVKEKPEKIFILFYFLSILELLQSNQIVIQLGEGYNNFWIGRRE